MAVLQLVQQLRAENLPRSEVLQRLRQTPTADLQQPWLDAAPAVAVQPTETPTDAPTASLAPLDVSAVLVDIAALVDSRTTATHEAIQRLDERTDARLRTLVTAALLANGWYQHKREWRRMDMKRLVQRYAEEAIMPPKDKTPRAAGGAKLATKTDAAPYNELRGARAGSGLMVAEGMVSSYCKGQPEAQAIIRQELRTLCRDLGLDGAPPVERELIAHVAECWVWLKLAQLTLNRVGSTEHTFKEGQYREGRVSEAQRRYLRALHLLAKLRHMGPAVQVNVANQQVVMNGREEG